MSDTPPTYPLEYQTTAPYARARGLVKLAAIFNLIVLCMEQTRGYLRGQAP